MSLFNVLIYKRLSLIWNFCFARLRRRCRELCNTWTDANCEVQNAKAIFASFGIIGAGEGSAIGLSLAFRALGIMFYLYLTWRINVLRVFWAQAFKSLGFNQFSGFLYWILRAAEDVNASLGIRRTPYFASCEVLLYFCEFNNTKIVKVLIIRWLCYGN